MVNRDTSRHEGSFDCLIVGGGPAGLTAATYLGRFRRRVIVVDADESRAKWIPLTRNCPGFPDGITGPDLLDRLELQAPRYGASLVRDRIVSIRKTKAGFLAAASSPIRARSVLIATGVVDILPDLPSSTDMIQAGVLRLCPICDGYEAIDKRVAVIGPAEHAIKKALFMRTFTQDLTVLITDPSERSPQERTKLKRAGIKIGVCRPNAVCATGREAVVELINGATLSFDAIYPAMGSTIRSRLAVDLGACCDKAGNLVVDSRQRTAVRGLYAAGDVVNEINQLAVAFGHAAVAATDMHNYLANGDGEHWSQAEHGPR
ncbi:MAG: NAD(P)/FAD-dependent oxidoreductase [Mesorhizobium sp.]|nr:MAG: NAD(P)/FAD-dependent oxidoreductase [Mesorhizobium sp.]TKB88320.1 MAG: NAD(P)/FAD-dependent oxidoreductase [Mesorhizobium sp.]